MLDTLRAVFLPLAEIVKVLKDIHVELKIMRELYETELMTRNPPVYRITEDADPNNVEVVYPTFDGDEVDDIERALENKKKWNLFGQYQDSED